MDVALIGEGTYPHQLGGVSVWCDQLVRGMADHTFRIVALVATGREPSVWQLPDNVASMTWCPCGDPLPRRGWPAEEPGPRSSRC